MNEVPTIRVSLLFTLLGLVIELFCLWEIGPAGLLTFAFAGAPLMLVGIGVFLRYLWLALQESGEF